MARLTVVDDDTPAPRRTPETISEALSGTARDVMAAMRSALAAKLDAGEVSSNAIASAYKELRELDRQIRALDHAAQQDEERRRAEQRGGTRRSFDAAAL